MYHWITNPRRRCSIINWVRLEKWFILWQCCFFLLLIRCLCIWIVLVLCRSGIIIIHCSAISIIRGRGLFVCIIGGLISPLMNMQRLNLLCKFILLHFLFDSLTKLRQQIHNLATFGTQEVETFLGQVLPFIREPVQGTGGSIDRS